MHDVNVYDERRRHTFYAKTDAADVDADLRALRDRSDADLGIDRADLTRACERFGGPLSALEPLTGRGTFHRLYRVAFAANPQTWFVARVPVPVQNLAPDLRVDAWAHDQTARAAAGGLVGVSVLEAQASDPESLKFAVEFLPQATGTCLADHDADEPFMQRALHAVGQTLRLLHQLSGAGYGLVRAASLDAPDAVAHGGHAHWRTYLTLNLDAHLDALAAAGVLTAQEVPGLRQMLRPLDVLPDPRPSLLHCDLGSHNVFVDAAGDVTALIDWEDLCLGDGLFDLAMTATFQPPRRHAALLHGYGEATLTATEQLRFDCYFLRIELAKVVHRVRFGYPDKPGRPGNRDRVLAAWARVRREEA